MIKIYSHFFRVISFIFLAFLFACSNSQKNTKTSNHLSMKQKIQEEFSRKDSDGDGFLSEDEIRAAAIREFKEMDTNKDGVITAEDEFGEGAISLFDTDGDMKITQEEFVLGRLKAVRKMDKDGDKKLTVEEIKAFYLGDQKP